jgi:undecaprenyl diphosphate synthase
MRSTGKKRKKSLNSNLSDTYGLDPANLPVHVAIIMDGNGRWAKKKLLNRIKGHEKGADTVRMVVRTCREIGISVLTLYAFSTENWERPKAEVAALMMLLKRFLISEKKEMTDNNIRLNVIGQKERLPMDVQEEIQRAMNVTSVNDGMLLNLALSYGSRAEIIRAVRRIAGDVKEGRLDIAHISDADFERRLYTAGMPDPELLIRTSGEMRISNFLLWQIAYSEIHVTPTLWPDFTKDELIGIIKDFQTRERRFGRVVEE